MNPVCVTCDVEMFCSRNGLRVLVHASFGPYKLIAGDAYTCRNCAATIVTGWASSAIWQHGRDPDTALDQRTVNCHVRPPD